MVPRLCESLKPFTRSRMPLCKITKTDRNANKITLGSSTFASDLFRSDSVGLPEWEKKAWELALRVFDGSVVGSALGMGH